MPLPFHKYHALGNDMIVIDPAHWPQPPSPNQIAALCRRHTGIGADGLCLGPLPQMDLPTMRFFNPDGSQAERSGNGLRIFARYLWDQRLIGGSHFEVQLNDETIAIDILEPDASRIAVTLGRIEINPGQDGLQLRLGNPHLARIHDAVDAQLAYSQGPRLEHSLPGRTNVEFVQILDGHTIAIEIWERGAGYTLASGTCSSAAAAAAIYLGHCYSPVTVRMPGGVAQVEIDGSWQVRHVSDVTHVFNGYLADSWFEPEPLASA